MCAAFTADGDDECVRAMGWLHDVKDDDEDDDDAMDATGTHTACDVGDAVLRVAPVAVAPVAVAPVAVAPVAVAPVAVAPVAVAPVAGDVALPAADTALVAATCCECWYEGGLAWPWLLLPMLILWSPVLSASLTLLLLGAGQLTLAP